MKAERVSIEYHQIAELKPAERNPRTHSSQQIDRIAGSIKKFGFTNPILIDSEQRIVAGHGRVEAAKRLGFSELPTIRLEHLSEAELRAYVIADNKLAENAGWDEDLLRLELRYITELDVNLDLEVTGFEAPEIEFYLSDEKPKDDDPADDIPEIDESQPPVSQVGDLWRLGGHRLLCGDATGEESFERLLGKKKAQVVFTDPPYNVPIQGHVSGLGDIQHAEFVMASGEMSEAEFTQFLERVTKNLSAYSVDGAIHFICMDWRHIGELLTAGRAVYSEFKNLCIWNKDNGGMGSLYRSKHELIFVYKNGSGRHINNVELGRHGRYRTNVWDYPGVNSFGGERREELAMHPTVKPVDLVADALRDVSNRGDSVLDCFGGSGTTLIAAEKTGRIGYLMELDPLYVDVIVKRYEDLIGEQVTHAETGMTFSETRQLRSQRIADDSSESTQEVHDG